VLDVPAALLLLHYLVFGSGWMVYDWL
jgi:hypothetical protein